MQVSQWGSKRQSLLLGSSEIAELANALLDAMKAIANGAIAGAAKAVENALSKSLPMVTPLWRVC